MGGGGGKDSLELYIPVVEIVNSRNSSTCASSNYKVQGCTTPQGSLAKVSRPFASPVLLTLCKRKTLSPAGRKMALPKHLALSREESGALD